MSIHQLYFDDIPLPQAANGQVWGVRCFPDGKMEPRQCVEADLVHYTAAVDQMQKGYTAMVWLDEITLVENLLRYKNGITI